MVNLDRFILSTSWAQWASFCIDLSKIGLELAMGLGVDMTHGPVAHFRTASLGVNVILFRRCTIGVET